MRAVCGASPHDIRSPGSSSSPTAVAGFAPAGLAVAPIALLAALPFGPLPEEPGWRGWLLPRLLLRHGPLGASLVVGAIWTFWHTPMFWFPGAAVPSVMGLTPLAVGIYLLQITGASILFTVVWLRTGGSVFIAVVFHTTFNTAETILFGTLPEMSAWQEREIYLLTVALTWVVALAALLLLGRPGPKPHPPEGERRGGAAGPPIPVWGPIPY